MEAFHVAMAGAAERDRTLTSPAGHRPGPREDRGGFGLTPRAR